MARDRFSGASVRRRPNYGAFHLAESRVILRSRTHAKVHTVALGSRHRLPGFLEEQEKVRQKFTLELGISIALYVNDTV